MAACAMGDEVLSAVPSFNTKKMRLSATRLENGAGELLERSGIDLELGLRELDGPVDRRERHRPFRPSTREWFRSQRR